MDKKQAGSDPDLGDELYKALKGEKPHLSEGVKKCLQRWKACELASAPKDPPLVACVLDHKYTTGDLDRGLKGLRGHDAERLNLVVPVAKSLGFSALVGKLTKTVEGTAEERCDYMSFKRARYGGWGDVSESDEDEDPPTMGEVENEVYAVSQLVSLDSVRDIGFKEITIEEECIVPRNAFANASPDGCVYDKDDIYKPKLEQWYERSVLILFRSEDKVVMQILANGPDWVLNQLSSRSHDQTSESFVSTLLRFLGTDHKRVFKTLGDSTRNFMRISDRLRYAGALRDRAIELKRVNWWNSAIHHCAPGIVTVNESIRPALETFDFKDIKIGLARLISINYQLQTKFIIIDAIAAKAGKESKEWLHTLREDAVASYTAADIEDVPTLLEVVKSGGTALVQARMLPNLPKTGSFDFLVALAKALHVHSTNLRTSVKDVLSKIVALTCECGQLAIPQWSVVPKATGIYHSSTSQRSTDRIKKLIDLFFTINQPRLCVPLHLSMAGDAPVDYTTHFECAKALHSHLARLPAGSSTDETKNVIIPIIHATLQAAVPKWESGLTVLSLMPATVQRSLLQNHGILIAEETTASNPTTPNSKTTRVCEFVDFCCTLGDLRPCVTLLSKIVLGDADEDDRRIGFRFREIYKPIIPQLKATLAKYGVKITSEPFKSFFKLTMSLYLSRILAPITPKAVTPVPSNRNVGCDKCAECKKLKVFINDAIPEISFRAQLSVRTHLESEIEKAKIGDIVTTQTVRRGSPHTLLVTKRPGIRAQMVWKAAQQEAVSFVNSIATGEELKVVMGENYSDLVGALHGTKPFESGAHPGFLKLAGTTAGGGDRPSAGIVSSLSESAPCTTNAPSVTEGAGMKRKRADTGR
ncbi:hypothetical protein NMY22_g7901 [Coprinellus aureogranulatus]|nr:hypothetical protein NMY22_g7901 [Coprinellus aureogranulatus]